MSIQHRLRTLVARQFSRTARRIAPNAPAPTPAPAPNQVAAAHREHVRQFDREVRTVAEGVHVGIGYGLANSILIQGSDGHFIVDTLEHVDTATALKKEFDALATGPLRAIIYTHNHTDHIFGSTVFGDAQTPVIAHRSTPDLIRKVTSVVRSAIYTRSMRQFGTRIGDDCLHAGIGPKLHHPADSPMQLLWPNDFVDAVDTRQIAGVEVVLTHVPGETPDHLCVYLPEHGVLIPGDNYYHAFPNLYAIRGTAYRDVMAWVRSIDQLIAFDAEVLVPCHTLPVVGRDEIRTRLTNYRDAIQYVHDQSVRGINTGLPPEQIAAEMQLPPKLAQAPYLQPMYGRVDWAVRAIYAGYLGWFDGNATRLEAVHPADRARRVIRLAGGPQQLLDAATTALADGEHTWASELADHLLACHDDAATALHHQARGIRAQALRTLGEAQLSANARNYYLTAAGEATGAIARPRSNPAKAGAAMLQAMRLEDVMAAMCVALNGPAAWDVALAVQLDFTDHEPWTLQLRNGVAIAAAGRREAPDVTLTMPVLVWKEMLAGVRNPATVLAGSAAKVRGDRAKLIAALSLFDAQ